MTRPFRPANGTHGEIFMSGWCYLCSRDDIETGDGCRIIAMSMAYDVDDPEYPNEWVYGDDGQPKCIAFEPDDGGPQ